MLQDFISYMRNFIIRIYSTSTPPHLYALLLHKCVLTINTSLIRIFYIHMYWIQTYLLILKISGV